jgi:hypothetical protein
VWGGEGQQQRRQSKSVSSAWCVSMHVGTGGLGGGGGGEGQQQHRQSRDVTPAWCASMHVVLLLSADVYACM